MSRRLMAMLVSSALVLGSVSTSAWSASEITGLGQVQTAQSVAPANNQAPLPPGEAAGIKQAQGTWENSPWVGLGLVAAFIIIGWILLDDDDDDDEAPTTGT